MREPEFDTGDVQKWASDRARKMDAIRRWVAVRARTPAALAIDSDQTSALHEHVKWLLEEYEAAEREIGRLEPIEGQLHSFKDDQTRLSRELKSLGRELDAIAKENEAKTADLRKLRKEIDPDEIKLRIMYAVDEAMIAKDKELEETRAQLRAHESEIDELKRSKKRLREAIERLSRTA